MVGWHDQLDGHEFKQTLGDSEGQGSLACYSPWGHKESDMTEQRPFHFSLSCIGEGNGNPLQCSCLENPRDRGAWWALRKEVKLCSLGRTHVFSIKGHRIKILNLKAIRSLFPYWPTQLCCCYIQVASFNMQTDGWGCVPIKLYS